MFRDREFKSSWAELLCLHYDKLCVASLYCVALCNCFLTKFGRQNTFRFQSTPQWSNEESRRSREVSSRSRSSTKATCASVFPTLCRESGCVTRPNCAKTAVRALLAHPSMGRKAAAAVSTKPPCQCSSCVFRALILQNGSARKSDAG